MNRTAIIIGIAYLVVIVIGAVLAFAVGNSTFRRREIDRESAERHEKGWMVAVILMLVSLLFATIFFTPYGRSAPKNAQVVDVVGIQFDWAIGTAAGGPIKAGVPVVFRICSLPLRDTGTASPKLTCPESADRSRYPVTAPAVAHGFGLYRPDDTLVAQANVSPGKIQELQYTFARPGTYRIHCIEFCGAGVNGQTGHNYMSTTIEVK